MLIPMMTGIAWIRRRATYFAIDQAPVVSSGMSGPASAGWV